MEPADRAGFFADPATLDPEAYVEVEYTCECVGEPETAAAHLASEQSTAQWQRPGKHEDLRPEFAARVVSLTVSETRASLSIPVPEAPEGPVHACRIRIAHPHANFGPSLPNLLSAVAGEGVFFVPGIPLIRLESIRFPAEYLAHFAGPRFGVAGLREWFAIHDRPFFFGVVKPNLGLSPADFGELAEEAWRGGLDIAKDDEMLVDPPSSPLAERTRRLGAMRRHLEAELGVRKGYLANITGEVAGLAARHDTAVDHGANAVMVNALPVGLSAVRQLRDHARVPLVAHFPLIAASSRLRYYGIHPRVWTQLQRLVGFDVIIMPGFGPRMMTPHDEVHACLEACREPLPGIAPSLPVPGGSDWAGTLAGVYRQIGSVDFGFVPGRGIFSHPAGPAAGARSIRAAWTAIAAGIPLADYARHHSDLAAAIEAFG